MGIYLSEEVRELHREQHREQNREMDVHNNIVCGEIHDLCFKRKFTAEMMGDSRQNWCI
jgi:hypothetical protein